MPRPALLCPLLAGLTMLGCLTDIDDVETLEPPTAEPAPDNRTRDDLETFYSSHGGQDAFPAHHIQALEALLYGQDDLEAGDWSNARARVDEVFAAMPLSTPIWRQDVGFEGLNIGDPVAYYGLRMLDQIIDFGEQGATESLQLTAVVAPCAAVTRPTLPDLAPETVQLDIAEEILANDARALRISTDLFRRWVQAITGGLHVELVVHTMDDCTTVGFTDDGEVVLSYPDASGMVDSVPAEISRETDFWWVVAPSGVPGDGSGYDRHFITGGMGVYGMGRPLFLSDDGWFTRKPEHLGSGPYSEIELRAYQPQWFQHEFMHHLFRTWPEFGLEDTSHQWFDTSTWPGDFVGLWESDYYIEAINKRLLTATPSLSEGLKAADLINPASLEPSQISGRYQRQPILNEWHDVTVSENAGAMLWSNAANVSWGLEIRDGGLWTEEDCPYGVSEVLVESGGASVDALWFGNERYARTP